MTSPLDRDESVSAPRTPDEARVLVTGRLMGEDRHPAVAGVGLTNRDGKSVVLVHIYGDQREATDEVLSRAQHEPIEIHYLPDGARIVARAAGDSA